MVDQDTVRRIAHLARIAVREEELAPLAQELSSILEWVEQLGEVDIEGIEPMSSAVEVAMKMREDNVTTGNLQKEVTGNAPAADDGFFTVPKVIE